MSDDILGHLRSNFIGNLGKPSEYREWFLFFQTLILYRNVLDFFFQFSMYKESKVIFFPVP